MIRQIEYNYIEAIKAIKQAILQSRYKAAMLANREMLMLYFGVGEYISKNSREGSWGTNAIEVISAQLQQELPGLKGFSATSLKKMRTFYEAWEKTFSNRPLSTDEMAEHNLLATIEADTDSTKIQQYNDNEIITNHQLITDDLTPDNLDFFLRVGFTHHYEIVLKTSSLDERLFYIQKCAAEFWSVEKLQYNIKSNLYSKQGSIINNFAKTISEADFRGKALRSFKDEYLLDFINIEDPDEVDERVFENEIVLNIKKFIMALGGDFSFMGNQYRIVVDEKEYFMDLLFFNRKLQSLVAIELKRGDFKPEYVGKLNFYLSALDEYVKMPHENPSIGIVLCKSQREKTVEFAFRDTSKPMGVAIYRTAEELPPEYKGILPDADKLKELMDNSHS
ncbi:MAG: PDDEXK nuclease domain-containing protein [Prevotellaceae bacterium]|jgi:predicted nuclease of restriction endonuclease-like (RecB) superfamily|nr:PDDEXK nuclease domain-containing protein [Prevotellaceae bacterium]